VEIEDYEPLGHLLSRSQREASEMKVVRERIEKRERKFKEMGMSKREALQRKLHEESLLVQRLMVFLLVSSILFATFAILLTNEAQKLLVAIPIIGIISCFFLILHTSGVKVELGALDKLLGEEERSFAGRNVGFWMAGFFFAIWVVSILEVVC